MSQRDKDGVEKLTAEQWRNRIAANKVYRAMQSIKEIARQVAEGLKSSTIISGPAGIGKTWAFEQALNSRNIKFIQPRVASEQALIEVLHHHRNGVFLFDECDFMFKDVNILNVLKRATDTKHGDKVLDYQSRNKRLSIPSFKFTGRLIFLTNLDLNSPQLLNDRRIGDHLRALNDRCEPYVMKFDHYSLWEYTCYLAIVERMLFKYEGADRNTTNEALRYFTETMWQRLSVSPRALTLIARNIANSPGMWRQLLEPTLLPTPVSADPVPPIPQLPDPLPRPNAAA